MDNPYLPIDMEHIDVTDNRLDTLDQLFAATSVIGYFRLPPVPDNVTKAWITAYYPWFKEENTTLWKFAVSKAQSEIIRIDSKRYLKYAREKYIEFSYLYKKIESRLLKIDDEISQGVSNGNRLYDFIETLCSIAKIELVIDKLKFDSKIEIRDIINVDVMPIKTIGGDYIVLIEGDHESESDVGFLTVMSKSEVEDFKKSNSLKEAYVNEMDKNDIFGGNLRISMSDKAHLVEEKVKIILESIEEDTMEMMSMRRLMEYKYFMMKNCLRIHELLGPGGHSRYQQYLSNGGDRISFKSKGAPDRLKNESLQKVKEKTSKNKIKAEVMFMHNIMLSELGDAMYTMDSIHRVLSEWVFKVHEVIKKPPTTRTIRNYLSDYDAMFDPGDERKEEIKKDMSVIINEYYQVQ